MRITRNPVLWLTLALAGCGAPPTALLPAPSPVAPESAPPAVATASPPTVPTAAPATPTPAASITASPSPTPSPSATTATSSGSSGGGGYTAPAPIPYMFVMNGLGKTIDRVDLNSGATSLSVLQTGLYPNQLLRDGAHTWLVNSGDATLDKLDLLKPEKVDTINTAVGSNPLTMVKLNDTQALVINYMSSDGDLRPDVAVLDLATRQVTKIIKLPNGAPAGSAAIVGDKIYLPAMQADYSAYPAIGYTFSGIHVIDKLTLAVTHTIALPNDADPRDITLDPNAKILFAHKGGLSLIDPLTDTVTPGLATTAALHSLRFVDATKAYAAIADGLVSFNPTTQTFIKDPSAKIPAGGDTSVGGFTLHEGRAYVPNFANDTVTVVDLATDTIIGTPYAVGDGPQAVVFQTKSP